MRGLWRLWPSSDTPAGFLSICRHACDMDTCWDAEIPTHNITRVFFPPVYASCARARLSCRLGSDAGPGLLLSSGYRFGGVGDPFLFVPHRLCKSCILHRYPSRKTLFKSRAAHVPLSKTLSVFCIDRSYQQITPEMYTKYIMNWGSDPAYVCTTPPSPRRWPPCWRNRKESRTGRKRKLPRAPRPQPALLTKPRCVATTTAINGKLNN